MAITMAAAVIAAPATALNDVEFAFSDLDRDLGEALEAASLLAAAARDGLTDPLEVFPIARSEYGRLIGVLYDAGHYAPVIRVLVDGREAADITPLDPPSEIDRIRVEIEPGPQFTFGRAEVTPLAPDTELPEGFRPGAPARSTAVRDAARSAVEDWRSQGHAKAEATDQDIVADHASTQLDAQIMLRPGPRLRFGALTPSGNERTRPGRIVKIAGLPEGEVFSPEEVARAANRLRRTGTFASVAIREADEPNPDGTLDFAANVVEAPLRRIGFGAEYDTESGVRLTAFWLHRNLFKGAERFRIEGMVGGLAARAGGVDYRLAIELTRPASLTPDTSLSFGTVLESVDERDQQAERFSLRLGFDHIFSDTLTGSAGLNYQFERARFGPQRSIRQNFGTLGLPLGLTWDRRDDTLNATEGFYLSGTVTPYLGLGSTDSGLQARLDARYYQGFGAENRVVAAVRGQIGSLIGAEIAASPRSLLFYSGGGGTVRGQPYQSLGVTTNGVVSGGRGFAAAAAELRGQITQNISVVGFADAGLVSEGSFGGSSDWHAGAGLGLRYATAVGPIRLDVGLPVHGSTGSGAQIYLGIGQAF